ncbi:hypothetical protein Tco_0446826 [Tanacetum coccineum]
MSSAEQSTWQYLQVVSSNWWRRDTTSRLLASTTTITVVTATLQSAIAISCNPIQHSRTKHIHTRYHFIKEQKDVLRCLTPADLGGLSNRDDGGLDIIIKHHNVFELLVILPGSSFPSDTNVLHIEIEILFESASNKSLVDNLSRKLKIKTKTSANSDSGSFHDKAYVKNVGQRDLRYSLNSGAGGNLLDRSTQDVLTIIENKSKVRNSRNKSIVSQVKSSDVNSSSSSKIAKLTYAVNQQTSAVTTAMTDILKQFQATPPPASVKSVEEICVTCGGAHPYYQCLAADATLSRKIG